ncbi:MAG: 5-formyltetrahydrofolate cyclo-ligase [Phycisphaerae bacterium]|jgi:5-formyltetrahydrofolate cyclo-ligase|nr:5-formyltetrahydrofolate cyclo-ligase [Phycisphaerae bacterium]
MKDKKQLRAEIKAVLAAMDPDQAARQSSAAAARLIAEREFNDARSVMIFLPIPGEINALDIARAAWASGKRVAVPKIRAPGVMDAIEIHSLDKDLAPGAMDILEPIGNEVLAASELDLIVAPALAFDRRGNRLGRGGGYYDRFISQTGGCLVCGLAFDGQLLDELPAEPHDQPVNMLATNVEFLRFARDRNG